VLKEFSSFNIDYYMLFGGELDILQWRTFTPVELFKHVGNIMAKRLTA